MSFAEPSDGARIIVEVPSGGYPVTLVGTVQPGDPISGGSTGWQRADASTDGLRPEMIAGGNGVSGDTIVAYESAILDFGTGCTAVIGSDLFLSDTAGDYSASTGTVGYRVGRMIDAQRAYVWGIHSAQ